MQRWGAKPWQGVADCDGATPAVQCVVLTFMWQLEMTNPVSHTLRLGQQSHKGLEASHASRLLQAAGHCVVPSMQPGMM